MITEICAGAIILVCLVLIAYLLFGLKPFKHSKKVGKNNTTLTITAKRNLYKVSVIAKFGREKIKFERKRIRKDQTVDFVYPSSGEPAKLIVEVESGKQRVFEV